MELKAGYKNTEIGVIPEEWGVTTIEQIADVKSGKRLPLGYSLVTNPTPHPYIRVADMLVGTVSLNDIKYVPEDVFPAIKRYRIYCEDIFISVAGSIGIVGKIPNELNGANLTENADRITNISCSQDYLLYILMSPLIQTTIDSIQTVGAQPKLALTRIRKFIIPLPALHEQHAIAAALSNVDALLSALDRLIAKKRDLKQATMQQLLTGQIRLPGFSGEWEVKRLGDVVDIVMGQSPSSSNYNTSGIGLPLIQGNADIKNRRTIRRVFTTEINKIGKCGDILMSVRAPVGEISRAVFDVCLGRGVCAIRYANDFMYHCLIYLEPTWAKHSKGSTFESVNSGDVKDLEINLPTDPTEQTAIATVLSDMDTELSTLESRRDKNRALKQGMMQELLTGRTRLI